MSYGEGLYVQAWSLCSSSKTPVTPQQQDNNPKSWKSAMALERLKKKKTVVMKAQVTALIINDVKTWNFDL